MPLEDEINKFLGIYLYMVAGVTNAKLAQNFVVSQTKDYTPEYRSKFENEINTYYQETKRIADSCMEKGMPLDDILVKFVDYYLVDSHLQETPESRADLYRLFTAMYGLLSKINYN